MDSGLAAVEVLVISAIPVVYALEDVLCCVGVYQIYDDLDTSTMGLVNKLLELVRFAKFAGNTEKIRDMVSE